jgi:DNA-binding transcriptional LysR family regulator
MDFDVFNEFVTLATHRSFVSAARDLNMSQPSLSRHMDALEKDLNKKLFFDTRPLSLTSAGEIVLKYSGKLARDYSSMLSELKKLPSSSSERIIIQDLLHANALYLGIKEAATLAKRDFIGLRVEYLNMDNSGLNAQQMLERGKVDVAFETTITFEEVPIVDTPDQLKAIWIPEFHGRLVVGIPKNSELASHDTISLKDLVQSRFILPANRHSERFRRDFAMLCREEGFYPNITLVPSDNALEFYSSDPEDGIHLLAAVDRKYRPVIASLLKDYVVVKSLSDKKRYTNAFVLVRRKGNSPALSFLIDFLERHAEGFGMHADTDNRR